MQFVYVRDLVGAMLRVAEPDIPTSRAYNLGDPAPVTQLEAVRAFARAAGREPRFVFLPRTSIEAAGGKVFEPPFYFGEYFDLPPISMRIDRARRELDFSPTPFDAGLHYTYQWYLNQDRTTPDFSFDERLTRL